MRSRHTATDVAGSLVPWLITTFVLIIGWTLRLNVDVTPSASDLEIIKQFLLDDLDQICASPLIVCCSPDLLRRTL